MWRGRRARVFVVGVTVGAVVGGVVAAQALSSNINLGAGDTAHVDCAGPSLSVSNQSGTSLDLTCAPDPTTSTTSGPTTTTTTVPPTTTTTVPAATTVTQDQVVKVFGTGTVTANVANTVSEIAVAFISQDDSTPGQTSTVTGGGLTWHLAGRTNTQRGDVEAWWATTAGAPFSATATPVQAGKPTQLTVMTFAGSAAVGTVTSASSIKAAPSVTLTPTGTGSWVGAAGMDYDHATLRTIGAGQTMDAQNTDNSGDTYWVQHLNALTTAGTAVTLNDTAPATDRFNLIAVEVTAGGTAGGGGGGGGGTSTPVLDAATPAAATVTNNVPTTASPSFSPPAATVVYAVFSMDSLPGSGALVSSLTNTGTPLTWTQTNLENHFNGTSIGGFVQVFWAYNATAQSNITVTATFNVPTKNVTPPVGLFQILVVDNAKADQTAAASQATWNVATTSAPSATVNTTANNSLVFAVVDNWDSSVTPTIPSGQSLTSVVLNPSDRDSYWVQAHTGVTPTPSAVTMNDTAPTNIRWHEIAWEILAA